MADPRYPARITHQNVVHAIRGKIVLGQQNLTTGVAIGTIPAGAVVLDSYVDIVTAFNAATTNVMVVGTSADDDGFVTSAGAAAGTAGFKTGLTGALTGRVEADTEVLVKFTQTGTAATTGEAEVVVTFYPHLN